MTVTFELSMSCGNAAFESDPATETARILRGIADRIEGPDGRTETWQNVYDTNDNNVGTFRFGTRKARGL